MTLNDTKNLPIGVFDSGLGGLTVVRELRKLMPSETILYLGDNARVPYGTRSPSTIERYAINCSKFLLDQGLKLLIVACNTVSSVALPALRAMTDVPVLGVISAGARAATQSGAMKIGVIGTTGTIASGAYPKFIASINPECQVFAKATPLFAPLVEEGWVEGEVPRAVAVHYIKPLVECEIDTLLLGCTHYPLLKNTISETLLYLGSKANILDSATVTAADAAVELQKSSLETDRKEKSPMTCFVTDLPSSFEEVAGRFFGSKPDRIVSIDI